MNSAYVGDILDQPRAIEKTLAQLRSCPTLQPLATRWINGEFRRVVLTGMGSSWHALHPLACRLAAAGIAPTLFETSELIHYASDLLDSATLVIAVSQSGRSAEILRFVELADGRCPWVAVTNTPDTSFAERAAAVVLTRAGEESSVSCKTYVTALAALDILGSTILQVAEPFSRLEGTADAVAQYLADIELHIDSLAIQLDRINFLTLAGRGPSLAAALTGGLIIKEAARFPAEGMSSAAFRHGPFEMVAAHLFVAVFEGHSKTRALNERLVRDITSNGGTAVLIGPSQKGNAFSLPLGPEAALPIFEILPAQMISLALAKSRGITPGDFRYAEKITIAE